MVAIGVGGFVPVNPSSPLNTVGTTIESDLDVSGFFRVVALNDSSQNAAGGVLGQWRSSGARYYVMGEERRNGDTVAVHLIDLSTSLTVLDAEYHLDTSNPGFTAHVIADDIIEHFTGLRGGFASKIAFVRSVDGGDEIFLMDSDGENARQLTFSKTLNMSPTWSPDGSSIAYSSLENGNWLIMMTNISTGQSVDITQWPALNTTPAFSPIEHGRIAFSSTRDGNAEVYIAGTDGKDVRRLTNHRRIDHSPAWSPDGSSFAFVSDRTGNPLIYLMNSDGTGVHRLTATPNAYEDAPKWSPQGDRIAFVIMSDYGFDIATASPSGDDVIVLTFAQGSNENPCWSPDGLRIIFTSTRGTGVKRLFVMNRDGSNVRPLTNSRVDSFSPAWAPAVSANDIRITTKR